MIDQNSNHIVDSLPVAVILLNVEGEVVLFNKMAVQLAQAIAKESTDVNPTAIFDFKSPLLQTHLERCLALGVHEFADARMGLIYKMKLSQGQIWISLIEAKTYQKLLFELNTEQIQVSKFKDMSEMAAGIAHEINNPLTVIYAKTSFLREQIVQKKSLDPEVLLDGLSRIQKHAERIVNIVSGMRSLSKDTKRTG